MEEQKPELPMTGNGDLFVVEDLFDFSNGDDGDGETDCGFDAVTDSSNVSASAVADSCNSSSLSGGEPGVADATDFSGDLCVPCDDVAELEWLSNFVEESFSSEDQGKLHLLSGFTTGSTQTRKIQSQPDFEPEPDPTLLGAVTNNDDSTIFNDDISVPAKARSKRSRIGAGNWASRLLIVNPTDLDLVDPSSPTGLGNLASVGDVTNPKKKSKKKDVAAGENVDGGRRCLHCSTDKTPQWRTGPLGPKTLCNACGVRYKSGRLVPEYRPAASPTFVLTKHSNSHRKVMELRRQKEVVTRQQQIQQEQFLHQLRHEKISMDIKSNGEDFLIHHHVGPDFRQLI